MKRKIEIQSSTPERKFIRYNVMRMVNGNFDGPKDFEKNINKQLTELNENLQKFLITWDISKEAPFIIVKI